MSEEPATPGIGQSLDVGLPDIDAESLPDDTVSSFQLSLSIPSPGRPHGKETDSGDCRDAGTLWHVADLHFVA